MDSYNLCLLPVEQQEKVEIDKAAAYAVFKTMTGEIATPEVDAATIPAQWKAFFLERCHFYNQKR